MEFKERLIQLRENKGWTKKYAAEKIGISLGAYANYEYGNREPNQEITKRIASAYDVSIQYLLTGDSNEQFLKKKRTLVDDTKEGMFLINKQTVDNIKKHAKRDPMDESIFLFHNRKNVSDLEKINEFIIANEEYSKVIQQTISSFLKYLNSCIDDIDEDKIYSMSNLIILLFGEYGILNNSFRYKFDNKKIKIVETTKEDVIYLTNRFKEQSDLANEYLFDFFLNELIKLED